MSAAEEPAAETAAAAAAPTAEEPVSTEGKADNKAPNDKKKGGKREEVPIEELYDLSKPIPRVSFLLSIRGYDLCKH